MRWPQHVAMVSSMDVLLLSLSGPLQAWGDSSRFTVRQTRREPTKSGVIGLAASALGRERGTALDDLCALEFGVRVDQPGTIVRDFQTERPLGKKPSSKKDSMPPSQRYYLADAKFLVALGGAKELIEGIEDAILHPAWPLFLGRRSCPPDGPILHRAVDGPYADIRIALRSEPWIASDWYRRRLERREEAYPDLEIVCDARNGEAFEVCSDLPLSFGEVRRYGQRRATHIFVTNPDAPDVDSTSLEPPVFPPAFDEHDPMGFL
jgi:CRISPR system Cascade subunit CasD